MKIISVVRDFEMYEKCVRENPFNARATFTTFDNRLENKGIPARYNEFLDAYDYSHPNWFVFCHEDWEIKEDWQARLGELDPANLYGPIGIVLNGNDLPVNKGLVVNTDRTGGNYVLLGEVVPTGTKVATFDCQCLIVHSSLIQKYNLRFDEKLLWDLYVEDFCIAAKEKYKIPSCIITLKCQHYSHGNVQSRFFENLNYLRKKYYWGKYVYVICVQALLLGRHWNWIKRKRAIKRFFYQKKITKSGEMLIKICKIPVYKKVRQCYEI